MWSNSFPGTRWDTTMLPALWPLILCVAASGLDSRAWLISVMVRFERRIQPPTDLARALSAVLRFDRDGTLWAATEGGLSRLKDGHIATLRSSNGLPCSGVY